MIALVPACHRTLSPATQRYPFTGRIISLDYQSSSALINGDNVPGFMDPMAMSYKIKQPTLTTKISLAPGDAIAADLVVIKSDPKSEEASDYWLENIRVTTQAATPSEPATNAAHIPTPGEEVPDFSLANQSGKKISLHQFRGHPLILTFIYTRCPFPDFCPRMSSNFAEIYKQLPSNPSLSGAHLLSISFDPEHDTPKVLREYAFSVAHTHDSALFTRWDFAIPNSTELPKLAAFFALTIKPEDGLITHNLSTAVISPDGKIAAWYHGSDWQVSDLIKAASQE